MQYLSRLLAAKRRAKETWRGTRTLTCFHQTLLVIAWFRKPKTWPVDGSRLALDNRAYNRLLRGLRWQGERGFAILIGRWNRLDHATVSPHRIGDIIAAALHLTPFQIQVPTAESLRKLTRLDPFVKGCAAAVAGTREGILI
ncbi:hypothetical protein [Micromonospora zamorensis]|uniref:hypothetical protein n=1 Tax=Micromonospora zamorensis TaxID=709883 RepID=UPI0037AD4EE3